MKDCSEFVGLTFDKAKELAESKGLVARVTHEDGEAFMCTRDYRLDRVNFVLEKGIVTSANFG